MHAEGALTRGLQPCAALWVDLTASMPGSVTARCFLLAVLPEWRSLSGNLAAN